MSDETAVLEPAPATTGAGVLAGSLVVAVVVTLPLHLSALRGEASVAGAMAAFAVALAVVWVLGAVLTWVIAAVDGDPAPVQGGPLEDDGDHRIVAC